MRPLPASLALALRGCLLGSLLGACHVVESKAWNLNELHDENSRHKYTGAIQGDIEFFFRHQVAGSFAIGGAHFDEKKPVAIEDPAGTCLENLIELQAFDDRDPRVAGIQVEWFARLAVLDPWKLSRERAVYGLARAGKRLSAGVPTSLPADATPAGPEAAGEALAGLVRAARPVLDHGSRASASERLDLEAACQVVSDLVLDLEGARRMLRATVDLAGALGAQNDAGAPILRLADELQRRCIRQALAKALVDREPRVRAAAVVAAVACAGPPVLDGILGQLEREPSSEVLVRVMDLVCRVGLPEGAPPDSGATPEAAREARLRAIYQLLDWPESAVRVAAMRALAQVSDAPLASLREEDWQSWWLERRGKPGP